MCPVRTTPLTTHPQAEIDSSEVTLERYVRAYSISTPLRYSNYYVSCLPEYTHVCSNKDGLGEPDPATVIAVTANQELALT